MAARLLALALALAMLAPAGAYAGVLYLCRIDGRAHAACCCGDRAAERVAGIRTERSCCCDVHVASGERGPAASDRSTAAPAPAVVAVLPAPDRLDVPPGCAPSHGIATRAGPPGRGLPLYIDHCSYRI